MLKGYSVREVTVSRGLTLNLGNFEFMRIDATCTVRVDAGREVNDDMVVAMLNDGWNTVDSEIREKATAAKKDIESFKSSVDLPPKKR